MIIMAMAISTIANAQCEEMINRMSDASGNEFYGMKQPVSIKDNEILMMVTSTNNFAFRIQGGFATSCIKENPLIVFLFDDNSTHSVNGDNKFNCDRMAYVVFGKEYRNYDLYELLKTKKLSAIRVETLRNPLDIFIKDTQATEIQLALNCLNWKY